METLIYGGGVSGSLYATLLAVPNANKLGEFSLTDGRC